MRHESDRRFRPLLLLVMAWVAVSTAHAGTLLGEWILVEQTYGEGRANLIRPDDPAGPVRLRFEREGAGVRGTIGVDGTPAPALSWPRLLVDDTRALRIEEKRVSDELDRVSTRYLVDPSPGDDLTLEITERYQVGEDGSTMSGTVLVRFLRDGEDRGSYLLHRRFERRP